MTMAPVGIVMLLAWVTSTLMVPCERDEGANGSSSRPAGERTTAGPPAAQGAAAGIHWSIPSRWTEQPARPMRIATYSVPPAAGDADAAECAVYYFGKGQGGGVDENMARWAAQFEGSPKPDRSAKEVNGLKVNLVQVAGAYLAPGGPAMQSQGRKVNYRLLGAIVEAPEAAVFFKCTGPAKTVAAAHLEFESLIGSVARSVV
jgi:hypothetical protein